MLRDLEREALEKLRDGFELVTGHGLWGIHCRLVKGGESHLLHRSVFSRLRNEGLVQYSGKKGSRSETQLRAVLTERGRKALEEDEEKQVSDL